MENVVLIIVLLLALALIGTVLLQRSEGGGLGMGGGGGGNVPGRGAGTALGKLTWVLGFAFFVGSLALTIIATDKAAGISVADRAARLIGGSDAADALPPLSDLGLQLPPTAEETGPVVPGAIAPVVETTEDGTIAPTAPATQ